MADDSVVSAIVRAEALQTFVDVHTPIVTEGRVHFGSDGLHTSVVDPANIAMHDPVRLARSAFESYDDPGAATIGVSFARLDDVLGIASADALVELRVDMATRHLHLAFEGVEQSVALIDPEAIRSEPDTPDGLELPNHVVVEGRQLARAAEVAELNGDSIHIQGHPDAEEVLVFAAEGDTDSGQVGYTTGDCVRADVTEATESIYNQEYVEDLIDAIPADAEVTLDVGQEFPMRLRWGALDGDLSVTSLIAPRITRK